MRKGFGAKFLFNAKKQLLGICTGSDATSEHECGTKPLMSALTNQFDPEKDLIARLQKGKKVEYPNLVELKRITKLPFHLHFKEVGSQDADTPAEAILFYAQHDVANYKHELNFSDKRLGDPNIVGAWDDKSFAIRVRGDEYVRHLGAIYDSMCGQDAVFGGMFARDLDACGVTFLIRSRFDAQIEAEAKRAQAEYESKLRLKARDESRAIMQEMRRLEPNCYGHVWAIWRDKDESEVVYGYNPTYAEKADYLGPYTKEELLNWAKAGRSYHLSPSIRR